MKKPLSKSEKHRYTRISWDVEDRPTIVDFVESDRLSKKITGLDEVVMGEWFHLERLGGESWYLSIDGRAWEFTKRMNSPAQITELK